MLVTCLSAIASMSFEEEAKRFSRSPHIERVLLCWFTNSLSTEDAPSRDTDLLKRSICALYKRLSHCSFRNKLTERKNEALRLSYSKTYIAYKSADRSVRTASPLHLGSPHAALLHDSNFIKLRSQYSPSQSCSLSLA